MTADTEQPSLSISGWGAGNGRQLEALGHLLFLFSFGKGRPRQAAGDAMVFPGCTRRARLLAERRNGSKPSSAQLDDKQFLQTTPEFAGVKRSVDRRHAITAALALTGRQTIERREWQLLRALQERFVAAIAG